MLAARSTSVARALLGACALVVLALPLSAQETGRVVGRVVDAQNGEPLRSAQVFLEDDSIGGVTDLNGRYRLEGVQAGRHTVVVQTLGYARKSVTGVQVTAGEATELDITMAQQAVEIEGLTVSAEAEEGSAALLLDRRRTASSVTEAVGAQEISRRPDSDAADVAQRMTGVTVSQGKFVFIRGLGERYSQTSLNGSSLPSPEPEKEVVPLDLFPSGFLESLETQKSYTPDLPVDFSGGSIKINTRDFPNRFTVKAGVSTSFNTNSQFEEGFLGYGGGGLDWLGLDDGTRDQPDVLRDLAGGVRSGGRLPNDPSELIEIGQALRGVEPAFGPGVEDTPFSRSFDLSIGGGTPAFDDGELGYFLAGTYSDSYELRRCDAFTSRLPSAEADASPDDCQELERKWTTSAFNPETAQFASPNVDYGFTRGIRGVSWGTIGNLTAKFSPRQKISLRTTVNVNTEDEARVYQGDNGEDIGGEVYSERGRFTERLMLLGQLSGEHRAVADSRLEWRLSLARASRDEPMLRETIYLRDPVTDRFTLLDFTESGRYFFSELTDDDVNGSVDWEFPLSLFGNREASVKVGAAYRTRTRDFGARRLNWRFFGGTIEDLDDALANGRVVGTTPRESDEFLIDEVVEPGDVYAADDERVAGYAMLDLEVADGWQVIVGARVENYALDLTSRDTVRLTDVSQTDIAPSVTLVFAPTDEIRLRGAFSRTVDRPEFRELAPFQFTEAASLRQLVGNPELTSAEITSGDLRLDWFPGIGELISVGGFYKELKDPIEQVFIAAASSAYSFQNAEEAEIFGLELDVQLSLARIAGRLRDVSFQGNYSWIDSEVRVIPTGLFNPTNLRRQLEGQAPYVVNLGLNWTPAWGFEAGVFYNRFGERVTAAGGSGVPDILEQPRDQLDATVAFPLPRGVRMKLKATNLLDDDFLFTQSANGFTRTQRSYAVGRTFSVGLSWEL